MVRSVVAVLAGAVVWALLWTASMNGLQAAFPERIQPDAYLGDVAILSVYIALSVAYSVIAGYVTAVVARRREVPHALALGLFQLGLGIYFESTYWILLPVWYHLTFLALLVPGNVFGGWMRAQRRPKPARA